MNRIAFSRAGLKAARRLSISNDPHTSGQSPPMTPYADVCLEVDRPEFAIGGDNGDMNLFKYSGGLPRYILVHHLVHGAQGNGGRCG